MRNRTKNILIIFISLAVAAMAVYNIFGHFLENPRILPVNPFFIFPFVCLLLSIAVVPFISRHWWEKNYPAVSLSLGALVIIYYILFLGNGMRIFATSYEYISFISLIGSLFVVTGGIHVRLKGKATPEGNVAILLTGAVLSNLLGTTGASMLLIRPYLRMNRYHMKPYHVVFFIFIVSNVGGALTPIGDPPLFLGYLKGIPFFWITSRAVHIWALAMGLILLVFYAIDSIDFHRLSASVRRQARELDEPEVSGLHNVVFLFIILGSVFIKPPAPLMLRETVMWGSALASYLTTKKSIHISNDFSFIPIKEVAILFAGIFATMVPALDWLELNASHIGIVTPGQYFWASGMLSSVLDNAPTYLNFLTASFGLHGANLDNIGHMHAMLGMAAPAAMGLSNPLTPGAFSITADSWRYIQAISLGAVFFGACTYIGNGPNFMVKSIAEQAKANCPGFFGYIVKYSLPVLIPIFALIWFIFFR